MNKLIYNRIYYLVQNLHIAIKYLLNPNSIITNQ